MTPTDLAPDQTHAPSDQRIDGWKAIANYFGRDRTTMFRWARERGMPVRSVPGGKTRTVYALASELEAWSRQVGEQPAVPGAETPGAVPPRQPLATMVIALLGLLALVVAISFLARPRAGAGSADQLPRDARTTALFVQARDDWALRSRDSLMRAIHGFEEVARRDPGFAPARADLADAYLLAGEAGSLTADQSFARAAVAAEAAWRIDPTLPAALRALGFIAYWRDHDRAAAGRLFRDALGRGADDAQTHFWYANILADNGDVAAAQREFNRARLLAPGSREIETDWAWARWSAGDAAGATATLRRLIAADPGNVEAHDCLSMVNLAAGDDRGYLDELGARARLRGVADLNERLARLNAAWRSGGRRAMLAEALRDELAHQAGSRTPDHAQAAFYAALADDRPATIAILQRAERGGERWGSAGFVRHVAARWGKDPAIAPLLARRRPPAIDRTI